MWTCPADEWSKKVLNRWSLIDNDVCGQNHSQLYRRTNRLIQGCTYDAKSHSASRLCFRCITPLRCRECLDLFFLLYPRFSLETYPSTHLHCTSLFHYDGRWTHVSSSSSSSRRVPNPASSTASTPIPSQPPLYPQMPFNPHQEEFLLAPQPQASSPPSRKRKAPGTATMTGPLSSPIAELGGPAGGVEQSEPFAGTSAPAPAPKKSRTNTPWSPAEEQRLKTMRDAGSSWGEIAKVRLDRA